MGVIRWASSLYPRVETEIQFHEIHFPTKIFQIFRVCESFCYSHQIVFVKIIASNRAQIFRQNNESFEKISNFYVFGFVGSLSGIFSPDRDDF